MFSRAKQAEVIRCSQKDEHYVSYLRGSIADIVQSFIGSHSWLRWRRELDLLADLLYFGLTTYAGYQTIGEEYVNIVEVDGTLRQLPSQARRAAMITLQVLGPYMLDWCLACVQRAADTGHVPDWVPTEARPVLIENVSRLRHVAAVLHRCHLALFYIRGVYYHLAKRATGIHYIQVRRGASDTSQSNYRLLGWLLIVQMTFTFIQQLSRYASLRSSQSEHKSVIQALFGRTTQHTEENRDNDERTIEADVKCSLCLEARRHSTATPCGHLFCWNCILDWCSTKAECPLCREPFQTSRLIYLRNYDNNIPVTRS